MFYVCLANYFYVTSTILLLLILGQLSGANIADRYSAIKNRLSLGVKGMKPVFFVTICLVALWGGSQAAEAATLTTSGSLITGATDIVVGSSTYDVSFGDGTCSGLFGGCDAQSDFPFGNVTDALAAMDALDTLFISSSVSVAEAFNGCSGGGFNISGCLIYTPYKLNSGGVDPSLDVAQIQFLENVTNIVGMLSSTASVLDNTVNPNFGDNATYAVWTLTAAVPVPASVWLFGSGLLGLIGIARRKGLLN